jgi:hypothetical protein
LFFFICKKNKLEIVKNDLEHFHHLDIILANGQSFQSKIVNLLNFEPFGFTHVGIIVKENNELFVFHSTPDGTKENGLRYDKIQDLIDLNNVCNIKVLRFNNLNTYYTENANNIIADLKNQKIPFDYDFNNYNNDRLYCSELVYDIFKPNYLVKSKIKLDKPIEPKAFSELTELSLVFEQSSNSF